MSIPQHQCPPNHHSPERAAAKETIWRLSALAFAHPTAEFYAALQKGRFAKGFSMAWMSVTGQAWPAVQISKNFTSLESGFITAFLHGRKGKPIASLLAGDYPPLTNGTARAVFMLNITTFYRHFGLKAAIADEGKADEPDHLVCMLEFMAVLAHLEARALARATDPCAYRRAQRDFLTRYLSPLLNAIQSALKQNPVDELDQTIVQLLETLPAWSQSQTIEFEASVGPYRDPDQSGGLAPQTQQTLEPPSTINQNLWG